MESKQCNKRTVVMRTAFSAWLNEMANGAPLLALRAHKYSVAMQCRIIITVLYDSVKGGGEGKVTIDPSLSDQVTNQKQLLITAHRVESNRIPAQLEDGRVARGGEIESPQVPVLHVVHEVLVRRVSGPLAFELEDHEAVVVSGRE